MFELKRSARVGYEDLMREFNVIEQNLMPENSGIALNLMVLEAKIRERFEKLEDRAMDRPYFNDGGDQMTEHEIQALIPFDIPQPSPLMDSWKKRVSRHVAETVGMAAALAVVTALGVFGLAALLQLVLSWI